MYNIHIERCDDASVGASMELAIDGAGLPGNIIAPPRNTGATYDVRVRLPVMISQKFSFSFVSRLDSRL